MRASSRQLSGLSRPAAPTRPPLPWSRAGALTRCEAGASVTEVRICGNTTCRRQGSLQVLDAARELAPDGLTVRRTGCLGRCGAGPNLVLLPSELLVAHCSTASHLARLLERQLPGDAGKEVAVLYRALELRLRGNGALERGDAAAALVDYTRVLEEVNPPRHRHLVLANRSAARLKLGDSQGALDDALAAQACAPGDGTWTRGAEREADARAALTGASS